MDADNQHPAEACKQLLDLLTSRRLNVAAGPCPERVSGPRKIAWSWIKATSEVDLRDLTSGFKAYDRLAIRRAASWLGSPLEYQDIGVRIDMGLWWLTCQLICVREQWEALAFSTIGVWSLTI